jgi:hypothetical protein
MSEPQPVTFHADPGEALRTATGPSLIMFPPDVAEGMCVLGYAADGKEIALVEIQTAPELLRRIVSWTPNGLEFIAALKMIVAQRKGENV